MPPRADEMIGELPWTAPRHHKGRNAMKSLAVVIVFSLRFATDAAAQSWRPRRPATPVEMGRRRQRDAARAITTPANVLRAAQLIKPADLRTESRDRADMPLNPAGSTMCTRAQHWSIRCEPALQQRGLVISEIGQVGTVRWFHPSGDRSAVLQLRPDGQRSRPESGFTKMGIERSAP